LVERRQKTTCRYTGLLPKNSLDYSWWSLYVFLNRPTARWGV